MCVLPQKYQIDDQIKHFAAIISGQYRLNNCFIDKYYNRQPSVSIIRNLLFLFRFAASLVQVRTTGVFRVAKEGHKTQARNTPYRGMDYPFFFSLF